MDDPAARAILRVTPVDGVKFDDPGLHPVEKAVRNNAIRADPGDIGRLWGVKQNKLSVALLRGGPFAIPVVAMAWPRGPWGV